jgi:hypothetical protein
MTKIYSKLIQTPNNTNCEASKDFNVTSSSLLQDDLLPSDQIYQNLPSAKGRVPANRLPPLENIDQERI